jgi:hypothetical protein
MSLVVKRVLPFILVLALGYALGYQDAYRGPASLGWKLGDFVDGMKPETVRGNRARNADAIRTQRREELPLPPN